MLVCDIQDDYEIIEEEKIMAPSPGAWHNNIGGKIYLLIGMHVATKKLGLVFNDHMDVHFPDGNLLQPDFIFISAANDRPIIDNRNKTIHGVPDMVVEIFSRSTMKRDMGIKKDIYESNGVKEYWLINPWSESIEVYLLRDGKYFLDEIYFNCTDSDLKEMNEEDRAAVKLEIPVAVLDGFKVKIRNIFGWYFE